VHVIPFSAEAAIGRVTIPLMESLLQELRPIVSGGGWNPRYNYEGFATYSSRRNANEAFGYVQVFRTGALEVVDCTTVSDRGGERLIPGAAFEGRMFESVPQYIKVEQRLGLSPPLLITITLLGVRGYVMAENSDPKFNQYPQPIDRDELALPEIVVPGYEFEPRTLLRPALDVLWHAAGWPGSPYSER
jgi:hypothetical protein